MEKIRMPLKPQKSFYVELPVMHYAEAWKLQRDVHTAIAEKHIVDDIVISLEHYPVFTLGRRGRRENLKVTDDFLERAGIPLVQVERGGDITFHAPGQLVVYPIINLDRAAMRVGDYILRLEDVMLKTAAAWNLSAGRNSLNRGIWVGDRKMGSIGIAIRRGITMHGMAFNVNLDLEPFRWINPCGLHGVQMTSMKEELSGDIAIAQVRRELMRNFEQVFETEFIPIRLAELLGNIRTRIVRTA